MSKFIKPIKFIFFFLFIVLFLGIFLITYLTIKSLPDYNRIVANALVKDDVKIFRNNYAIPNIIGKTKLKANNIVDIVKTAIDKNMEGIVIEPTGTYNNAGTPNYHLKINHHP